MRFVAIICVGFVSLGMLGSAARAADDVTASTSARISATGMNHYKSADWNFELDVPKGWNAFPPLPGDNHGMVIRFLSNENGYHSLAIFRTPSGSNRDPKAPVDQVQAVLAKDGFTNFVRSEVKVGTKTIMTLDSDKTVDGHTANFRHYFVEDPAILHILGFSTTNRDTMFPIFDLVAKSFVFRG